MIFLKNERHGENLGKRQLCKRLRSGGLKFQTSPGQKVHETLSQEKKLGMVVHTCHPSYVEKYKQNDCSPG
jgi:hypothetical protein